MRVFDARERPLLLFSDDFALRHVTSAAKGITMHEVAI
jgi:hypothetical protein